MSIERVSFVKLRDITSLDFVASDPAWVAALPWRGGWIGVEPGAVVDD